MDIQAIRNYWLEEAEDSLRVMDHLFEKGDYSYALFLGHLAVEMTLKAIYAVRKGEHAPYSHNLQNLAELAGIDLTEEKTAQLVKITDFNIKARYPDQKRAFRKKCTEDFTGEEIKQIKDILVWLKSLIQA